MLYFRWMLLPIVLPIEVASLILTLVLGLIGREDEALFICDWWINNTPRKRWYFGGEW